MTAMTACREAAELAIFHRALECLVKASSDGPSFAETESEEGKEEQGCQRASGHARAGTKLS